MPKHITRNDEQLLINDNALIENNSSYIDEKQNIHLGDLSCDTEQHLGCTLLKFFFQ